MLWGVILWSALVTWTFPMDAPPVPGFPATGFESSRVYRALQKAYPGRFEIRPGFQHPVLLLDGQEFLWAEGRLLPRDKAGRWAEFSPQPFYEYTAEVADVASWSKEKVAEAEARLADRRNTPLRRDSSFFDALWGIRGRKTADAAQKKIRFLGLRVTVHHTLAEPLARVQASLQTQRAADPTLDTFLKSLSRLEGYNWRDIAETQSRSNHAYGAAIDLIPRSYKGKTPYWLWSATDEGRWFRSAWLRRWQPHPAVVAAFEKEGFVWGGKWLLFDTIHFEYRPEILVLNQLR